MGVTWLDSRVALTVGIVVGGAAIGFVAGRVAGRRGGDMFTRYYLRRVVHFIAGLVVAISLAIVWRPFAGRIGLVLWPWPLKDRLRPREVARSVKCPSMALYSSASRCSRGA